MEILFEEGFEESFLKLDKPIQKKVTKYVDRLPHGDIVRIQGNYQPPLYRLKVGKKHRILMTMTEHEVRLLYVDNRKDVYRTLR